MNAPQNSHTRKVGGAETFQDTAAAATAAARSRAPCCAARCNASRCSGRRCAARRVVGNLELSIYLP